MEGINAKLDALLKGQAEAATARDVRDVKEEVRQFNLRLDRMERWRTGGDRIEDGADWRLSKLETVEKKRNWFVRTVVGGSLAAAGAGLWAFVQSKIGKG